MKKREEEFKKAPTLQQSLIYLCYSIDITSMAIIIRSVACKAIVQSKAFSGHLLTNKKVIHLEVESSKKVIFPTTLLFKATLSKFSLIEKLGLKNYFHVFVLKPKKKLK